MNEACIVPWRSLDSRSEQQPRRVSSRAGALIWEIPVAGRGGVEPGSWLQAVLSCHGWMPGRTSSLLILLVQRALQGDVSCHLMEVQLALACHSSQLAASFTSWEQAGSSKIIKTDGCWELGLMNRSYVSCCELLSIPPTSFSPHQSDSAKGLLVYLPLQSCLFPTWRWKWNHRIWRQDGNREAERCDVCSTLKCLPVPLSTLEKNFD